MDSDKAIFIMVILSYNANLENGYYLCFKQSQGNVIIWPTTCSWHQKNETTNSPIHEFKVLQNVF